LSLNESTGFVAIQTEEIEALDMVIRTAVRKTDCSSVPVNSNVLLCFME
jgi:hypothetical protein